MYRRFICDSPVKVKHLQRMLIGVSLALEVYSNRTDVQELMPKSWVDAISVVSFVVATMLQFSTTNKFKDNV